MGGVWGCGFQIGCGLGNPPCLIPHLLSRNDGVEFCPDSDVQLLKSARYRGGDEEEGEGGGDRV